MTRHQLDRAVRSLPREVHDLVRTLKHHGHEAYLVGGAVRNIVLGIRPVDFDFATSAPPREVTRLFRRVIPTGIQHGTVTVLAGAHSFEVTTFRWEAGYADGRRPDSVSFIADVHEDLRRRDFTMNAMAIDPTDGRFLDPHHGQEDISRRLVRAIGEPGDRFREDALRMLRAVRFAAQLGFSIDGATLEAIGAEAHRITGVSHERIRDEFLRVVMSDAAAFGLRLLRDTGLLVLFLPELVEGVGVEQRGGHHFDVFEHSIRACESAEPDPVVRLAALFHDVGKPRALVVGEDGERRFHGHDALSARMTEEILRRLKFPNATVDSVAHLVRHHMFHYTPDWTGAAVRRFLARVGADHVEHLLSLRAADSAAATGERPDPRSLAAFRERLSAERSADVALTVRDLAVNGHDLMAAGILRGRLLGVVLDHLLETVLDDPAQNTREHLLTIAKRFYEGRLKVDD